MHEENLPPRGRKTPADRRPPTSRVVAVPVERSRRTRDGRRGSGNRRRNPTRDTRNRQTEVPKCRTQRIRAVSSVGARGGFVDENESHRIFRIARVFSQPFFFFRRQMRGQQHSPGHEGNPILTSTLSNAPQPRVARISVSHQWQSVAALFGNSRRVAFATTRGSPVARDERPNWVEEGRRWTHDAVGVRVRGRDGARPAQHAAR